MLRRGSILSAAAGQAAAAAALRVPSIKFLGKRPKLPISAVKPVPPVKIAAATPVKITKIGNGVDFATLKGKAWFGRPMLSDAEMEAITSGGATSF
jgi:hypothetical protein